MLGPSTVGRPLAEVLALQDQDGSDWSPATGPTTGCPPGPAVPEQSWLLPNGTEVLVAGQDPPAPSLGPVERGRGELRSGRGRARLDRERSDLVATVAHELRSPLTGVKGFVAGAAEPLGPAQRRAEEADARPRSHADSDRLTRLITELLDVARIDTGRLPLYPRPVDAACSSSRIVESVAAGTARADRPRRRRASCPRSAPTPTSSPRSSPTSSRTPSGTARAPSRCTVEPGSATSRLAGRADQRRRRGRGHPRVDPRRGCSPSSGSAACAAARASGMYIVNGLVRAHGGTVTIADAARRRRPDRDPLAWPSRPDADRERPRRETRSPRRRRRS